MSIFLRWSLMIFIIKGFRTIVFIFIVIVISTTFRPICPPASFRCLLSKFLRRSLMIFIIKGFRTIVFIFIVIVISTTFRPICPPTFSRCLSNSGTFTELWTTSFIECTWVTCSDSVSHNRVQVLSIPVLLLDVLPSSGGCRFKPDWRRVTIQEYLTLVPGYSGRNQNRQTPWI